MISSEDILSAVGAEKLSSAISTFSVLFIGAGGSLPGFPDFFAPSGFNLYCSAMAGICGLVLFFSVFSRLSLTRLFVSKVQLACFDHDHCFFFIGCARKITWTDCCFVIHKSGLFIRNDHVNRSIVPYYSDCAFFLHVLRNMKQISLVSQNLEFILFDLFF